jgi:hypothetical protein
MRAGVASDEGRGRQGKRISVFQKLVEKMWNQAGPVSSDCSQIRECDGHTDLFEGACASWVSRITPSWSILFTVISVMATNGQDKNGRIGRYTKQSQWMGDARTGAIQNIRRTVRAEGARHAQRGGRHSRCSICLRESNLSGDCAQTKSPNPPRSKTKQHQKKESKVLVLLADKHRAIQDRRHT